MLEFAATGTICELDLFGNEVSYYELSAEFDMPNDATRIAQIKALVDSGYADRITVSHDIHTKHRLVNDIVALLNDTLLKFTFSLR